jgi:hypothetical protein
MIIQVGVRGLGRISRVQVSHQHTSYDQSRINYSKIEENVKSAGFK